MPRRWWRLAFSLVAVVLSLCLVTARPAAALGIPNPVAIGKTLVAGAAVIAGDVVAAGGAEGAVAAGACGTGIGCVGIAVAGIGLLAYQTRDAWMPVVKGLFGGGYSHGDSVGVVCRGGADPQIVGGGVAVIMTYSGCGHGGRVSVGRYPGTYSCISATGVVTTSSYGTWPEVVVGQSVATADIVRTDLVLCPNGNLVAWSGSACLTAKDNTGSCGSDSRYSTVNPGPARVGAPVPPGQVSQTTVVNCRAADNSTFSLSQTTTGAGDGAVVPSCEQASPGSIPEQVNISAGWPGAEAPIGNYSLATKSSLQVAYPDCFNSQGAFLPNTCTVRVWVNGHKCDVGVDGCTTWETGAQDGDTVQCKMGHYIVKMSACDQLKGQYSPGSGVKTLDSVDPGGNLFPSSDPHAQANPSSSPAPTSGPNPGTPAQVGLPPSPESDNCWGAGWSWNPVSWVYVPVKCVLTWAFVPPAGFLDAHLGDVNLALDNSVIGHWKVWITGLFPSAPGEGCAGIPVDFDLGKSGHSTHVHWDLGAACGGDPLHATAAVAKPVVTAAVVVGAAVLCFRLVVGAIYPGVAMFGGKSSGGDET